PKLSGGLGGPADPPAVAESSAPQPDKRKGAGTPALDTPAAAPLWNGLLAVQHHEITDLQSALNQYASVVLVDSYRRIELVNDRFCAMSKFRRGEMIGWDCRLFCAGLQLADFYEHVWQVISRGSVWRGDLDLRARDGQTLWSSTTIVPRPGKRNAPRRFI